MKTLRRMRGISHDELYVTQEGSTVTLWSASGLRHTVLDLGALHSPGLEYARNALLALAFAPSAGSILLLGLGGGSICHMLSKVRPQASIDAVEIDPVILELAKEYFRIGSLQNLQIHLDDAANFLAIASHLYDIIILDTYVGEQIPSQCTTQEFFSRIREHLSGKGVVVINWMRGHQQQYEKMVSILEAAVGPIWVLHGYRSRNSLIFASPQPVTRQTLIAEAERLEIELPSMHSVVKLVRHIQASGHHAATRAAAGKLNSDRDR